MVKEENSTASEAILARAEYLGLEGANGDKLFAMAGKFEEHARKLPGGKLVFGMIDNAERMIPEDIRNGVADTAKEKLNEAEPEEGSFIKTVMDKISEGVSVVTNFITGAAQFVGEKLFDTKSQQSGKQLSAALESNTDAMNGIDNIAENAGISEEKLRETVLSSVAQDDARDVLDSMDLAQQNVKHGALQMLNKAMGKETEAFDDTAKVTDIQSNRIFNNVFKLAYEERVAAGDSSEAALLKANEVAESVTGMKLVKEDGEDVLKPSEKYVGLRESLKESFVAIKEGSDTTTAIASADFSVKENETPAAANEDVAQAATEATADVQTDIQQDETYSQENGVDTVSPDNVAAAEQPEPQRGVAS